VKVCTPAGCWVLNFPLNKHQQHMCYTWRMLQSRHPHPGCMCVSSAVLDDFHWYDDVC
jgi:hypothetical protein